MRTRLWSCLGWRRFPRDMTAFEARRFVSAFRGPSSLAPAILLTSPIGCGAVARVVEAPVAGSSVTLDRYRLARQAREELVGLHNSIGPKITPLLA